MIRFNIVGTGYLDLVEDGGVGFKKENQLFRFNDISIGRSTEFSIPNTGHNRTVLNIGNDPAMYGDMMRKRHACQLQYDCGQVIGTLAVTSFNGDSFSCVFYEDDAKWIRDIQEKKLSEVVQCADTDSVWWSTDEFTYQANAAGIPDIALVWYDNGTSGPLRWQLLPSVDITYYLRLIEGSIGVPVTGIDATGHRLIMCTLNGGNEHSVTLAVTGTNAATVSASGVHDFQVVNVTLEWARANVFGIYVGGGSNAVKGFKALRNMKVTFPTTVSEHVRIVKMSSSLGQCEIVAGGPSDPLAGKTVDFDRNQTYCFVGNDFISMDSQGTYYGWKDVYHPLSVAVTVSDNGTIALGDMWYLANNHPDMTVFEFLKSVGLSLGYDLTVSAADGIVFSDTDSGGRTDVEAIGKVVGIDHVSRKVECWGGSTRSALVRFDSEDYVIDPILVYYDIDNGQLEDVNEFKIAFNEGTVGDYGLLCKDVELTSSDPELAATKVTIARQDANETYLQRVLAPFMDLYDEIRIDSTYVTMKVCATESAFFGLKRKWYYQYRGVLYRWTSAEWSDGILSLHLQKVAQYTETTPKV